MALVERTVIPKGTVLSLFLGRVLPHTGIVALLMFFLTEKIPTLHTYIWTLMGMYAVFAFLHSYAAYKRVRFRYVFAATALFALLLWALTFIVSFPGEAGHFYVSFIVGFILLLLLFSLFNNFWFLASRIWYIGELTVLNAVWLIVIVTGIEAPIEEAIGLSLPLVAYSLYIMLFDYAFLQPLHTKDKTTLFLKYAAVILILFLATLFGFLSGISKRQEEITRSYSLMSSQGGLYVMDDRARMEEDFRIPLDSKELVFIANIAPTMLYGNREHIGYYLKFHSLYNYDPQTAEFNSQSDEMEDPYFFVRQVDITSDVGAPRHLAVDLAGNAILPPYALRTEGTATIYNVKLDTKQSFANNLTYRFVAYPADDSVMVGEKTMPVLGVYRLFNRISTLNIIPVGTSGLYFDFDYNKVILERAEEFYNPESIPRSFTQQYLNYSGLERDIVDTMKAMLNGKKTLADKMQTVFKFFTATNEAGEPVFTYDVHPGKSSDPNETMLHYFLMKNRRGYCTYYATAAALFFRVAGIPARVAIGFVPGETSKKNPGWYYVYSQQGHAWTEVYLGPNLGWLDVDLTPGGESEMAPPPPDPSPPKPPVPPKPVFELRGIAGAAEPLFIAPEQVLQRTEQEDIPLCTTFAFSQIRCEFDSAYGNLQRATAVLSTVEPGDTVVLTGREDTNPGISACSFERFSWYSIRKLEKRHRDSLAAKNQDQGLALPQIPLWLYLTAGAVILFIIHSIPTLHLRKLRRRALRTNDDIKRLAYLREWLIMLFHINGYSTENETDSEYAARLAADPGVNLAAFVSAYHRSRYYHSALPGSKELAAETIGNARSALKLKRNIALRFWSRIHLWEYFRVINRKKTA